MSSIELPDTSQWLPSRGAEDAISLALQTRCRHIENAIIHRISAEKETNLNNFDSGPGLEEIVRGELDALLPTRYSVVSGVVCDAKGFTAGHCDALVFNKFWVPQIKQPAVPSAQRSFFPIEGVYAVLEIKQSLTESSLLDAMEKLVKASRLDRPMCDRARITENRTCGECSAVAPVPLHTMILAAGLGKDEDFQHLINIFVSICAKLERRAVVRALCVLGEGVVTWGVRTATGAEPAHAVEDSEKPLVPILRTSVEYGSAWYPAFLDLWMCIHSTILQPDDLVAKYALAEHPIKMPKDPSMRLLPDSGR
ncbi:MAG: hypothetical protein KF805_07200 [Phycisphaeraceae bacterium]|nr:hypothetical protein [Phycisphaeraceae bacterium]